MSSETNLPGGQHFQPYVPADQNPTEFTLRAVLLGIVMAVILGAANAYIGLKAGLTVAATFPAAVIGMAALRLMKGSILEENMTRTIASVGEALVAGAIFTIPAFKIAGVWDKFNYLESTSIMLVGGVLVYFTANPAVSGSTDPEALDRMSAEYTELMFALLVDGIAVKKA